MELKERASGRAASQLFPPVKRSVQQGILVIVFVTKVIQEVVLHDRRQFEFFPCQTLTFID